MVMKTTNWSRAHEKLCARQQDSKNKNSQKNTIAKWGQKIAKRLDDLDDRWTKLATYTEPKIWEKKDRLGNTYFRVDDPKGDRYLYFHSEDEVRWWLDQRYYL